MRYIVAAHNKTPTIKIALFFIAQPVTADVFMISSKEALQLIFRVA
jgi:hypothetical protein